MDASYQILIHLAKRLQRRRFFRNQQIRNKNGLWWPCLMSAHLVPIHLQTWPPQTFLVSDWLISKKSYPLKQLCQMNRNLVGSILGRSSRKIAHLSALYRGPSKDASYQVSIHLPKRFQRRKIFRNQPIRNKNCLWRPCLITDRDEMSNFIEDMP
jgi:hypothetical protein